MWGEKFGETQAHKAEHCGTKNILLRARQRAKLSYGAETGQYVQNKLNKVLPY